MADAKITALDANTTPVGTDLLAIVDDPSGSPETQKITLANLGIIDGWIPLGACTYESSDDPTYTFSFASDMTAILSAGMKIKLTDSGTQYFIITAVGAYSGGKTIITGYGGTDYDLSTGAITNPYYSTQKAPFGFPLSPAKWTVEVTETNQNTQTSPTNGTWYNLGSISINIPIGVWRTYYKAMIATDAPSGFEISVWSTLSTANNSESDDKWTSIIYQEGDAATAVSVYNENFLSLAAKDTYYLNSKTTSYDSVSYIRFYGNLGTTVIRAVCAYL